MCCTDAVSTYMILKPMCFSSAVAFAFLNPVSSQFYVEVWARFPFWWASNKQHPSHLLYIIFVQKFQGIYSGLGPVQENWRTSQNAIFFLESCHWQICTKFAVRVCQTISSMTNFSSQLGGLVSVRVESLPYCIDSTTCCLTQCMLVCHVTSVCGSFVSLRLIWTVLIVLSCC